jgi:hypothetical protein
MTDVDLMKACAIPIPVFLVALTEIGRYAMLLLERFSSGVFALCSPSQPAPEKNSDYRERFRIERRTRIFDETIELTARYYLYISGSMRVVGGPFDIPDDRMISVMCLDRKIATHFSGGAYAAWRGAEKMIANRPRAEDTASAFSEARRVALEALGNELR